MTPWIGTLLLALFLGVTIAFLPDRRPEVALHPPKESPSNFTWILSEQATDPLPALLDTTPLYLPTLWNFSPKLAQAPQTHVLPSPVSPIQVSSVVDRQAIWDQVSPKTQILRGEENLAAELSRRSPLPIHRFWQSLQPAPTQPRTSTTPPRLSIKIQAITPDILPSVILEATPPSDWSPPESLLQPLLFQVIVTPEGIWGVSSLDSSLRENSIASPIRDTVSSLPFWSNAPPGTYQVVVGPF